MKDKHASPPSSVVPSERPLSARLAYTNQILTALMVLAAFYTIYLTRSFLLPIVFATLLSYLLAPPMRRLDRLGLPSAISAGVVLLGMLALCGLIIWLILEPLTLIFSQMPENLDELQRKVIEPLQQSIASISQAGKELEEMTDREGAPVVAVEEKPFQEYLLNLTPVFLGTLVSTIILLYFILAYKAVLFVRLIHITPRLEDKKRAVEIFRTVETTISYYLLTIFVINACLGIVVGSILALLGFPNPILWGVIAGTFNFVPYLGSIVGVTLIGVTAVVHYESLPQALMIPAIYAGLSTIEGNFVTPTVHGRAFTINPIMIIVGLLFWSWLWGFPGALLAVPILVVFKVICSHVPALKNVDELMGQRNSRLNHGS